MGYAVVTGASGGIGLCLARELAAKKFNLLLIARSEDKLSVACQSLEQEFKIKASYLTLDLSEKKSMDMIHTWILQNQPEIEVLVNNAGYGLWGAVEQVSLTQLENMMKLNMTALVDLCYLMIPYLRKRTPSHILNVASMAGFAPIPVKNLYYPQ